MSSTYRDIDDFVLDDVLAHHAAFNSKASEDSTDSVKSSDEKKKKKDKGKKNKKDKGKKKKKDKDKGKKSKQSIFIDI